MNQLSIAEKARLLYDNLKDIKYALATYVDMSDKELGQYSEVILTNLGTQGSNKTAGNLKIRSTPIEAPTNFGVVVEPTGITYLDIDGFRIEPVIADTWGSLICDLVDIEPVVTDVAYMGTIGSVEIRTVPIEVPANFGIAVEPAGIAGIDLDGFRIEPVATSIVQSALQHDFEIEAVVTDASYVGIIGGVEIYSAPVEVPIVYGPQKFIVDTASISVTTVLNFHEFNIETVSSNNIIQKQEGDSSN